MLLLLADANRLTSAVYILRASSGLRRINRRIRQGNRIVRQQWSWFSYVFRSIWLAGCALYASKFILLLFRRRRL